MMTLPLSVLSVSGKDARDLLQRLTTNEVVARKLGELFPNVFTSDKGRVLELCTMLVREDDILVLGQVPAAALARWIAKMTFREKVQTRELDLRVVTRFDAPVEGADVQLHGKVAGVEGYHGLVPSDRAPAAGEAFERYRIAHGIAWMGKDIGDDNNPHEAGLSAAISWSKGCYIGQEVVARLDTYDKVQRRLRRLRLEAPVAPGTRLTHLGADVGVVTSVSGDLALGYVHRKAGDARELEAAGAIVNVLEEAAP